LKSNRNHTAKQTFIKHIPAKMDPLSNL